MKITVLIDNETQNPALETEHGLSFFVEHPDFNLLFDTGKSDLLLRNATQLGIDLSTVDYVVLSHGHYDHTGGLEAFLSVNDKARILLKKEALLEKWSSSTGEEREIGLPLKNKLHAYNDRLVFVDDFLSPHPGILLFGKIQKTAETPFVDPYLFLKLPSGENVPDHFSDELILVLTHNGTNVVFTGCAHNGIANMLTTVKSRPQFSFINLVIGGTHLKRADDYHINALVDKLHEFNIKKMILNHCSGISQVDKLKKQLDMDITYGFCGEEFLV